MATGSFSIGAWIVHDRWQHDINHDHFGDLSTMNVVTEGRIGEMEQGTPLHYVLEYLIQRVISMESSNKHAMVFPASAYIMTFGDTIDVDGTVRGIVSASAVKQKAAARSFTIGASRSLAFTIDAVLRGYVEMSLNAVIA